MSIDTLQVIDASETDVDLRANLRNGNGIVGYCGFMDARTWARKIAGDVPHDVWYSERNGDPITLIVPAGTLAERMPYCAKGYMIFKWIQPEDEFAKGVGVVPMRWRR